MENGSRPQPEGRADALAVAGPLRVQTRVRRHECKVAVRGQAQICLRTPLDCLPRCNPARSVEPDVVVLGGEDKVAQAGLSARTHMTHCAAPATSSIR
eukprot:5428751-Pyramimonas_sp.AAC.1